MVVRFVKKTIRPLFVAMIAAVAMTSAAPVAEANAFTDFLGDVAGAGMCTNPIGLGASALSEGVGAVTGADLPSCFRTVGKVAGGAGDVVSSGLKNIASGAFEAAGLSFGEAGAELLKFALGWWISIPGQDAGSFQATLGTLSEYTYWIQVAFLTSSIIFLGARLAMARSGTIRDTSEEGFRQLARATVIAGCIGMFVVLGTRLSDNISEWFMAGTVGSDPDALVDAMIQIVVYTGPGGVALLFVIGIIGIIGGLVMAFLLLMRMGFLVVISAALPIAATAGGTKIGSQAYEKMIAWTLAFLLFKPVGSFVIGTAAVLFLQSAPSQEENGGALTAIVGAFLLASAALVLPALMRLIVPAMGSVGGGGSGMAAATGAAAVGAQVGGMVATGGASGGASAGGGSGGGGSGGASGGGSAPTGASADGGSAPSGFGGGGNPGGGADGQPSSSGGAGLPGGGENGSPAGSGTSGGEPSATSSDAGATYTPTGAQSSAGGFEG